MRSSRSPAPLAVDCANPHRMHNLRLHKSDLLPIKEQGRGDGAAIEQATVGRKRMLWFVTAVLATTLVGVGWLLKRQAAAGAPASTQIVPAVMREAPADSSTRVKAPVPDLEEMIIPPIRKTAWVPSQTVDTQHRAALSALIQKFPPLSPTVNQILAEVSACDCRPERVAQLVAQDPMLVLEVLRFANSAAAAQSEPVTSVHNAIMLLGYDSIIAIAMRSTMTSMLGAVSDRGFNQQTLLRHNLATGLIASAIANRMPRASAGEATTLALLHDIGKIVFNITDVNLVDQLLDPATSRIGESRLAKEERYFGVTHATAGALLAARWNLPTPLIHAIELHHHPAVETLSTYTQRVRELTSAVFVANQLAKFANCPGDDIEIDIASPELFTTLNLPPSFEASFALIYPEVESKLITLCDLKPHRQSVAV
jgi:putative nucleotidyltransferase with HDIG domain